MSETPTTPTAPSQVRFSARAVARTIVQTIIPAILTLGVIVPYVVDEVLRQAGGSMPESLRGWLLATSAFVAGVAAVLSKVMTHPKVEAWLRSSTVLGWLAAEPSPKPPVDVDPTTTKEF